MEVKYEPLKEIVILQRNLFLTPEELARFASIAAGGNPTGLYWVDGVVFLYFSLQTMTEMVSKALVEDGRLYWSFVGYSLMKDFQPVIETKEKMMVPVVNISSNAAFRKVAEWLKVKGYPEDKT